MHFYRVHLTRQIGHLGRIACISKQGDVMRIWTQRASLFAFVKESLYQIYNSKFSVMTNLFKDVYHSIICAGHQIIRLK